MSHYQLFVRISLERVGERPQAAFRRKFVSWNNLNWENYDESSFVEMVNLYLL